MKRFVVIACMCLATIALPTNNEKKHYCQEENKHHVGIDFLIKVGLKDGSGNNKICQSVSYFSEDDDSDYNDEDANDYDVLIVDTLTETSDDKEDTLTETSDTSVETDDSSMTYTPFNYKVLLGGGVKMIIGFMGCPDIKSISEYSSGNNVYAKFSTVAPWDDKKSYNPMSYQDALDMVKKCRVSVDVKCDNDDKDRNPLDTKVFGAYMSYLKSMSKNKDIIDSFVFDKRCVKDVEISIRIGDMCHKHQDLMYKDHFNLVDGKETDGVDTLDDKSNFKSCV
ncbi:Chemokine binding protein [NY_014 poxvirus]|uniref:Chemokine binding protein n=1 Tax=NY_014 poxvirus TaxID=2025360 RepID=UPI000B99F4AE|nr:Chemokine binding protein [NY_014 poxvirus]AST09412.1 Chemokine binding protein [NY_014 poxvirus]